MWEVMQPLISGPVLPATLLLGVVLAWSLFTIIIGYGLELDGHLPFHLDNHLANHPVVHALGDALGSVVLTPTKWLNLRSIPLILWLSVFAIAWWGISVLGWFLLDDWLVGKPGRLMTAGLIVRNLVGGLILTKYVTAPMQGWFRNSPHLDAPSLLGAEAEIASYDATPEHGQAKFRTGGAPLLLNVRTDGPHLPKGTRVWITYYDSKRRIYLVSPTTTNDSSPSLSHGNES